NKIVLLSLVLLLLPGCGGGGGGGSHSSSSSSSSSSSGSSVGALCSAGLGSGSPGSGNVIPVTVGDFCGIDYLNEPTVSVTVCTSQGSSNCLTIGGILLDTGSYGLRIFNQALSALITTPSNGTAECVQYADGSADWGWVQNVYVTLGSEQTSTPVPIQVIDSAFGARSPAIYCPGTLDVSPSGSGFNGILGVGPLVQDCGLTCVNSVPNPAIYYTCNGLTCTGTTVPLANQVSNPVASLPTDNNGLIVQLPGVDVGGAVSLTGSLVLGIGTQSNNSPSGATAYTLDPTYGEFTTTFSGVAYVAGSGHDGADGSFTDSGSNGLFFPSPTSGTYSGELSNYCSRHSDWFCPATTTSFSATIIGYSGTPVGGTVVPFQIGNFTNLINSSNMVFIDIGGNSPGFDWGLPFYFGRNVYIGFENTTSSLGTGPYFAY